MENLLLTEAEACQRLKLGRSTLRRLWAEGAICPVKIGRSLRYPSSEITRFVTELQAQAQIDADSSQSATRLTAG